ncbi:YbgA family protein [Vibrio renipiscarius]|uniref:YbgA family protein n=1 Tax=Vibrio renipiscarius TaxID=1461322 RepID=UPI00354DC85D
MDTEIKIGVSACVLGETVRFDGGHKSSRFVTKELGQHFQFVPVCPEVESGMPVPRPTIRLVSNEERIALVETRDATKDHTDTMVNFSRQRVGRLQQEQLRGYVVCAKSPTCGMERVKVYGSNMAEKSGVGLYTQELMEQMPWLPIEEDGRLNDPILKENFVTRVFCLHDFYQTMDGEPTAGKIVSFHSRYKLTLMAHHPASYKELGKLVAKISDYSMDEFYPLYRVGLMAAMTHRASRKNNTNVLMHIQGYFKKVLDKNEKAELCRVIDDYRVGLLPLLAPLTLLKHHMQRFPDEYLQNQKFLNPYPQELRLRYAL